MFLNYLLSFSSIVATIPQSIPPIGKTIQQICHQFNVNPNAKKIILVMDNLNTHNIASLYKAFPPEEARRLARKIEIHYTPKHGSWLDIAEIGINIMTRECLNRRIPNISTLREELKAWNEDYNSDPTTINWQFCNETSRVKLKNLYPNIERNKAQRDLLKEKKSQIK